jgi:excisionase family DNA binding protein
MVAFIVASFSMQERVRNMFRISSPNTLINLTDEELLELYLSLPTKRREERFADTARAAEITDVSVRTIQLWIESGAVRAITVGRKYRVDLISLREYLKSQMDKRKS